MIGSSFRNEIQTFIGSLTACKTKMREIAPGFLTWVGALAIMGKIERANAEFLSIAISANKLESDADAVLGGVFKKLIVSDSDICGRRIIYEEQLKTLMETEAPKSETDTKQSIQQLRNCQKRVATKLNEGRKYVIEANCGLDQLMEIAQKMTNLYENLKDDLITIISLAAQ